MKILKQVSFRAELPGTRILYLMPFMIDAVM